MDIAHLCQREVVSIDADSSLQQAAALMRQQHVGALVVSKAADGEARRVVGLVTDRDLAVEVIALGVDPATLCVGDLPHTTAIIQALGSTSLVDCAAAMQRGGVRRVLVVNDDGDVLGVVSADDLVSAIAQELGGVSRALRSGIDREVAHLGSAPARARLSVGPPERASHGLR